MENSTHSTWKSAFTDKGFRLRFLITVPFVIGIIASLPSYFTYLENRTGVVLYDPLLSLFQPVDVSVFTFTVTYLAGILGLVFSFTNPKILLRVMQAYVFMMSMRIVCLYLIPLNPPENIIPLSDVFLEKFFYSGKPYLNDLFFSGHTATILVFAFAANTKLWRWFFTISATLIGAGVIIQHVHYTIDVLAAPVFVWIAWRISVFTSRAN